MSTLELFDFQHEAVTKLVEGAVNYFQTGPDRHEGRNVPYVGQLKAVTGAGKTPILATAIGKLGSAVVLWTTKFGSVVDQTVSNLRPGGKYHHLLSAVNPSVEVIKFTEIPSYEHWKDILRKTEGLTILVSTVATWNSAVKDERLNVHRVGQDWGTISRWDQLRTLRQRPLWVVYDEAHNTTTEQVELLDEQEPAGFFVASASPVKGKLLKYLSLLSEESRKKRIVPVSTRAVVEAQLLKSTISLADYQSSAEEMIREVVARRKSLEQKLTAHHSSVVPKAIYVVETSNATTKDDVPRPVFIWRTLVKLGVNPSAIAVCTGTKDLPAQAIRVETLDQLSEQFTHIIFNKRLQEGWDDPSVYLCYFDGKTESAVRIQQVIGRALRQPRATHLPEDDLNTAFFFVRCPTELLEEITDDLKAELRIYKTDEDPDDFEPFEFRIERKAPKPVPLKPGFSGKLKVPQLQLELPSTVRLEKTCEKRTYGFDEEDRRAPGKALVNVVSMRTGDVFQNSRDLLEDMRVRCGTFLQDEIRMLSRPCANSIHPRAFKDAKLDKTACYNSKALAHYAEVAREIVAEYETGVQLRQHSFEPDYEVGDYQPTGDVFKEFINSGHPKYDTKSFNDEEMAFAKALDKYEYVWVRNRDRVGYGIPLPLKSGSSYTFYPDFLWWVKDVVWAVDPTGDFILREKIRTKLMNVDVPLRIALVTRGEINSEFKKVSDQRWTLMRYRSGNATPELFDTLEEILETLIEASM